MNVHVAAVCDAVALVVAVVLAIIVVVDNFRKLHRNYVYCPNYALVFAANVAIVLVWVHEPPQKYPHTLTMRTRQMSALVDGGDDVMDGCDVSVCRDHYYPLAVVMIDGVVAMLDSNCR